MSGSEVSNGWKPVFIYYTDKFAAGASTPVSYNTFAYPTKVTDPDGFESKAEYRYDFGAVVKATGPPPAGQSAGAIVRRVYDTIGRLEKVRTEFNGNPDYSYTRWTYPSSGNKVNQYTTITDGAGEAYSFTQTDGLGRPLRAATEHPGSIGGYSTVATEYDALGRPWKQSVPTETDQFTNPAGDDSLGYLYRQQTYDWKGRPLVTTNTDGTQRELQYGGCGCAGGETVTLIGEQLAEGRRRQKIYSDFAGRTIKTEILNYNHTETTPSIYASTVTEYNARDQVRFVKQYAGPASGTPGLQSERQYDGHGRVLHQYAPPMLAGTWTTFAYNTNDTVQSVTDARNATATYTYNARRLVTGITYSAPANITPTAPVSFLYDAVGNRTQMTDGSGSHLYYYDQFSRMTSETQTITGLAGAQTLSYTYTLAGQLKSLTDPQGRTVNYGYDRVGRTSAVTGVGYSNTSQFMGNFQYRAWGAVSHFNQGVNLSSFINVNYNTRLKPSHFEVGPGGPLYPKSMDSDYTYNADGQIQFAADKVPSNYSNVPYGAFDRAYRYDHQGRLIEALSGTESRGGTTADGPYNETYNYNALGNMTARSARLWSGGWNGFNHTYTNGRNQSWQYDAAGHVTQNDGGNYTFDAAGRVKTSPTYFSGIVGWGTYPILWQGVAQQLDNGDGQTVKQVDTDPVYGYPSRTDYYVRSTVLKGNVIARVHQESGTSNTEISIYHAGERIARSGDSGYVEFEYRDPITGHYIWQAGEVEVNPFGQSVGTYDPGEDEPGDSGNFPVPHEYGNAEDVNLGCVIDGIASPCQEARRLLDLHVADAVPLDYSDDITDFTTQTEYEDEDYDDGAQPTIDENGVINVPSLRYRTLIKTSVTPIKRTIANRKLTAQEKKVFNSAFNEAYNRLSRPECAEAVSGGNAGVVDIVNYAKDVFDGFTDSVTYAGTGISEDGDTFASIPTADLGARHGAHLSLYDNFFEDNAVIVQKISSRGALPKAAKGINIPVITLVQARASTLLHELAHAFGIKHNNQKESNALNDKILLACFPEVATAIQVKYGTINPRN